MNKQLLAETGVATLMAVLGAAIAVIVTVRGSDGHRRRVQALVYFSAGVLIAVMIGSVVPESAEVLTLPGAILAAVTGAALLYFISRFICPVCPACAIAGDHTHGDDSARPLPQRIRTASRHPLTLNIGTSTDGRRTAILVACMVAAHATLDGVAIATGQESAARAAASNGASGASAVAMGIPLIAALSLHKMPEGLALAGLILGGGFGRWRSFLLTAGIEASTLLGGALGASVFAVASPIALAAFLAHTGGGFSYLAYRALAGRPATDENADRSRFLYGTAGFAAAATLLVAVHSLPGG